MNYVRLLFDLQFALLCEVLVTILICNPKYAPNAKWNLFFVCKKIIRVVFPYDFCKSEIILSYP